MQGVTLIRWCKWLGYWHPQTCMAPLSPSQASYPAVGPVTCSNAILSVQQWHYLKLAMISLATGCSNDAVKFCDAPNPQGTSSTSYPRHGSFHR